MRGTTDRPLLVVLGGIERLIVVTSDFHCERAALLFERLGRGLAIETWPAHSNGIDPSELRHLEAHERSALARMAPVLKRSGTTYLLSAALMRSLDSARTFGAEVLAPRSRRGRSKLDEVERPEHGWRR